MNKKRPHCKKCHLVEVPRGGMLCPRCRKPGRARGNGRSSRHTGRAADVLAHGNGQPVGQAVPKELFTTYDILSLYCAKRHMIEQQIDDRAFPYLFAECGDIAALLNGNRLDGRGKALAECWRRQLAEMGQEKAVTP